MIHSWRESILTIATLVSMESSVPGPAGAKTSAPNSSPGNEGMSFVYSASPVQQLTTN